MVNGTQVAASIGSKMKVVDAVAGNTQAGKLNYVEIEGTLVGCLGSLWMKLGFRWKRREFGIARFKLWFMTRQVFHIIYICIYIYMQIDKWGRYFEQTQVDNAQIKAQ